jgi:hypothetical protein
VTADGGRRRSCHARAKPLFEAIRHDLAHAYDTSLLAVRSGPQVVGVLTWKSLATHLTIRTETGSRMLTDRHSQRSALGERHWGAARADAMRGR